MNADNLFGRRQHWTAITGLQNTPAWSEIEISRVLEESIVGERTESAC